MRNEKYRWPEKYPSPVKGVQSEESVCKEDPKGSKKWKLFFDIMAIAFVILLLYGVFIYLPSTMTSTIDCDGHPCDTFITLDPLI